MFTSDGMLKALPELKDRKALAGLQIGSSSRWLVFQLELAVSWSAEGL